MKRRYLFLGMLPFACPGLGLAVARVIKDVWWEAFHVDSSGWLEYFTESKNADFFAPAIEDTSNLLVPVICVYEVFKRILGQMGLKSAEIRIADLYKGQMVEFTAPLALSAAVLSVEKNLPMADSIILATANAYQATLWTQDELFKDIPGVQFIPK